MFIYIFESNSCSLMYPCISLKHVGWLNPTSLLLPKQLPPSINCASNSKLPFFVGKMAQKHFPKLKMFNSSGIFCVRRRGSCRRCPSAPPSTRSFEALRVPQHWRPWLRPPSFFKPTRRKMVPWKYENYETRYETDSLQLWNSEVAPYLISNEFTLEFKDIRHEEYVNVVRCSKFSACWPLFQSLNNLNVQQCCIQ